MAGYAVKIAKLAVGNTDIGRIHIAVDLPGYFTMNRWKNIILNGLEENYFDHQIDTIRKVTAAEIRSLANKYLQPERFYELVVV